MNSVDHSNCESGSVDSSIGMARCSDRLQGLYRRYIAAEVALRWAALAGCYPLGKYATGLGADAFLTLWVAIILFILICMGWLSHKLRSSVCPNCGGRFGDFKWSMRDAECEECGESLQVE